MTFISRISAHVLPLLIVLLCAGAASAQSPAKYWIFLTDKPEASYDAHHAISERALWRRALRGSHVGADIDLPVSRSYRQKLQEIGIRPVVESRWLNAVSAVLTSEQISIVKRLPFVTEVHPVGRRTRRVEAISASEPGRASKAGVFDYGPSETQLQRINAIDPIERGINGSGVRLGFLDTPFGSFDHPAFQHLKDDGRIIADSNFVGKPDGSRHGMNVASVAVGFAEGNLIGPGYGAEILAATTEFTPTETNQEEDFFVAGMEWMEAMGADVVNVSLGYTTFDPGQRDYTPADLNGDTGVTTIAADRAAALGIVVVVAAGNEASCGSPRDDCWYYISTPADGDSVIAVAAVTSSLTRASFSGIGPPAHPDIKPDVAAPGVQVQLAFGTGYTQSSGTSFAAPLVSGVVSQLLQVNPSLNPIEVREILRATASQSAKPDTLLGWGVIDAAAAVNRAIALGTDEKPRESSTVTYAYPNPATDNAVIHVSTNVPGDALVTLYDLLGRRVLTETGHTIRANAISFSTRDLRAGVYFYTLEGRGLAASGQLVIVR